MNFTLVRDLIAVLELFSGAFFLLYNSYEMTLYIYMPPASNYADTTNIGARYIPTSISVLAS